MGKGQPLYTVGENINWSNSCGSQCGDFSKLSEDTDISLQDLRDPNSMYHTNICKFMFIYVVFIILKKWNKPRCP